MKKQEPNMEQFQIPTVYSYFLSLFGPEGTTPPRIPRAYSSREYSKAELNQILYKVQNAINSAEDRDRKEISTIVEKELHKAGFATEFPETRLVKSFFPARVSYKSNGKPKVFSVLYDKGEWKGNTALGQYIIELDEKGKVLEKKLVLEDYARKFMAEQNIKLENIE